MGSVEIDESRWPLVTVRFEGIVDDETFRAYLEGLAGLLRRGESYALLFDARHADRTPPVQRKMQAEWMQAHEAELRRLCVGTAFVITSPLVRGVLTAVLWISPMAMPHTVVSTVEEAERWLHASLRANTRVG